MNKADIILESANETVIELVNNFGLEVTYKFIEIFDGSQIYIPKFENLSKEYRNSEIYKDYQSGVNYSSLRIKYNLSEKTIRTIVNSKIRKE